MLMADDDAQQALFDAPPEWKTHWQGMPEYEQKDLMPWQTIKVHFRSLADRKEFAQLLGQQITDKTQFLWYPKAEIAKAVDKRHRAAEPLNPRYPVYVPTKGRWESRQTIKALEALGVPYYAVVEPQEFDSYASVIAPEKILTLPFSNLGQGSIPARNWIKQHSIEELGALRHWQIDDNITCFYRLNQNTKIRVGDGTMFRAMEDFCDRYTNMVIGGPNYFFFAKRKQEIPAFLFNTRVYSCSLVSNEHDYWWRDRYNEDTDICLRVMKDGLCTVQFNAFLAAKATTMTVKGGNTDELYKGDGRRLMAESLKRQHPDVVTITEKFGHVQHQVDYTPFRKNRPVLRDGVTLAEEDPYRMSVQMLEQNEVNTALGALEDEAAEDEAAALAEIEQLLGDGNG